MMNTEKKQTDSQPFKFLKTTVIYAAIAFFVCFIALAYLNNKIVFANTEGPQMSASTIKAKVALGAGGITVSGIPFGAEDLYFSNDDAYCTYMYNYSLYVKDMKTGNTLKTIDSVGVTSPVLMNDRNILLYFTVSGSAATLNTYNIDSGQITKQASINYPYGSKIKAVAYSNATNLEYVNVERIKNGTETDRVYSINIMKEVQQVSLSSIVNNMVLLGKYNTLYYNNPLNTVYENSKFVSGIKKGKIIGRDGEDRVYIQSASVSSMVYVLADNKLSDTLQLPDANVTGFYSDQRGVYAVYSDYIVNLADNIQSKLQYGNDMEFAGMGGSNAYFRDANGNIVGLHSSIS